MTAKTTSRVAPAFDGDSSHLKSYVKLKQAVARHVRGTQHQLRQLGAEQQAASCDGLMSKLAEDRFTLAVVGQFKRGKSSLMNAVIGRELLPTGVLPLTSAITVLRFGPQQRLIIARQDWSFDEEAPIAALSDYVTEAGNPGNQKRIKAVYVEFPSSFLRRGLEFADTPGVGSAIEANTITTYEFIPKCDAVLFVTGADGPLAAAEKDFLIRIRQHVRKIFFVVNKMDLVSGPDNEEVLHFVSDTLSREIGGGVIRLFPLSSRLAMEAKGAQDAEALARSGLPQKAGFVPSTPGSSKRSPHHMA